MSKPHHVEILKSGMVVKAATEVVHNEKLSAEISRIRSLCEIYPECMVPILFDGTVSGRRFYAMERIYGDSLSEIVFNSDLSYASRREYVSKAFTAVREAIDKERSRGTEVVAGLADLLSEEWNRAKEVKHFTPLLQKSIVVNGRQVRRGLEEIYREACELATKVVCVRTDVAHFNFHFGNILRQADTGEIFFVDPDSSMCDLDPLFGLARFAFSFWHEIATEMAGAVIVENDEEGYVAYRIAETAHSDILLHIPELASQDIIFHRFDNKGKNLLRLLTLYCFLRSIRINAVNAARPGHGDKLCALPQEVLTAGCALFFDGR
jgi:hypothetical protein